MDHGPPGSSVHGILQARKLEWVGLLCPPPGGIFLTQRLDSLPLEPPGKPLIPLIPKAFTMASQASQNKIQNLYLDLKALRLENPMD